MKAIRVSATLAILLSLSACGGNGEKSKGENHGGRSSAPPPVSYSGPAIPGLEAKPVWSVPNAAAVSTVGLGKTFAVARTQQGTTVSLLDAATGKVLGSDRPLAQPTDALSKPGPPGLIRDTHQGVPVVVVRYKQHVPANGMQGDHDQNSDMVLDETGREVWHSPTDTDAAHFYVGGYFVDGHLNISGGFVQGAGPYEGIPVDVDTITAVDGGRQVKSGRGDTLNTQFVYAVRGTTAVETHQGKYDPDGIEGLDLTTGKPTWTAKGVEYFGTFGNSVLTSKGDYKTEKQQLTFLDAVSGRRIATSQQPQFDCHVSAYDKDTGSALCASERLGRSPLTVLDVTTAQVRWKQPTANARNVFPHEAAGGVAYLVTEESGSGTEQTHTYLAVNDRTGQVLADNLPIDDITLSDSGIAMVSYQGTLYGFRMKKLA